MVKLIRSEFIKNRVWVCSIIAMLLPVITGALMKIQIIDRTAEYIDISIDTYTFALFCNSYLFFILPVFALLISSFIAQNESRENGWILVLSIVKKEEKIIMAKCFINIFIVFVSYISFTCVNCYLLQRWGMEILFTTVIIPMLYSFLCFIPHVSLFQILSIVISHMTGKVFLGMFFILLNVFVTQTKYNKYFFPSFYIKIAQDVSYPGIKVTLSIFITAGVIYLGAKLMKKAPFTEVER